MKKGLLSLFLICILAGSVSFPVHADTFYGKSGWHVAFTGQKKMESNFKTADLDEAVSGLQPGDNIIFTLSLQNDYQETTDWWMTNEVLHSLEDSSANSRTHGGAYTYVLTYTDRSGEKFVLFDSDTVGGEIISGAGEGLHEATDAMEEYFYLDTLATGQRGTITLEIVLDGETQGNDYQDTLADLQMNFAVELNADGTPRRRLNEMESNFTLRRNTQNQQYELVDYESPSSERVSLVNHNDVVRTGDETGLAPYLTAMAASGILLLLLAIYSMKQGGKDKKGAE